MCGQDFLQWFRLGLWNKDKDNELASFSFGGVRRWFTSSHQVIAICHRQRFPGTEGPQPNSDLNHQDPILQRHGSRSMCQVSSGPQRKREVAKRRLVQKRNIGERPVYTERTVRARKLQICREKLMGEKKYRWKIPVDRRTDKDGRERSGQA